MIEQMIEAVNAALEIGDWAHVVRLTVPLYEQAVALGEVQFAELVQDLHWIANDALTHPVEVAAVLSEEWRGRP